MAALGQQTPLVRSAARPAQIPQAHLPLRCLHRRIGGPAAGRALGGDSIGAPNIDERSEKDIISAFVNRIADLSPQLITFNGSSFDLPVLRYRAMVCGVAAPGLALRPYFNRYTEDAVDLCDVLASFSPQNKASLHELCRVMGLPGKPDGIDGSEVEKYVREGHIAEVAAYCETDVVNTYRVWLRYELFRGRLTEGGLRASEANLSDYIQVHSNTKPHLLYARGEEQPAPQSGTDALTFVSDTPEV
jgi:3'-5' exonuclease